MATQDPEAREWLEYFMSQPSSQGGEFEAAIPEARSFVIEVRGEDIVLIIRFADGRERALSMTADVAFYLREYLAVALKSTETYGHPGS